jgi:hypothetical protein
MASPLANIREIIPRYLIMKREDQWAIEFMLLTVMSSKASQDAEVIHGALAGPPACAKTELMRVFDEILGLTESFSEATAHGFISGSSFVKTSLLHRLDRRCLLNWDMTAFMKKEEVMANFFGVMRAAFDGRYRLETGASNEARSLCVRFAMMVAVTDKIYTFLDSDADMGQRMLICQMARGKVESLQQKIFNSIMDDNARDHGWRKELKDAVGKELKVLQNQWRGNNEPDEDVREGETANEWTQRIKHLEIEKAHNWARVGVPFVKSPTNSEDLKVMYALARSLTRIRSAKYTAAESHDREEGVGRVVHQTKQLACIRAACDNRDQINSEDIELLRVVAHDTLTPPRLAAVKQLLAMPRAVEAGILAKNARVPYIKLLGLLGHWTNNDFVVCENNKKYRLSEEARSQLETCKLLESVTLPPD